MKRARTPLGPKGETKVPVRLFAEERRQQILGLLEQRGALTVEELSERFAVSTVTIRSDLDVLSSAGQLIRSHGGAVKGQVNQYEVQLNVKETLRRAEKRRIAEHAARLVCNGETLLLDSGTTTLALARILRGLPLTGATLITNSLPIALEVAQAPHLRLIMLGGVLRPASQSMVGPHAEATLSSLYADRAFIGVDGLDLSVGLSTPDVLEARLTALMMERSRQVVLVADASKFGRRCLSVIAPLRAGFHVITDRDAPAEAIAELRARDLTVTVV